MTRAAPIAAETMPGQDLLNSFDEFYRLTRPVVGCSLALVLGDSELGYEAADEAMSRAFKHWQKVRTFDNPEGWVFRTGLNWARSFMRRRKLGRVKHQLAAVWHVTYDRHPDADLERAISSLTADHRSVVVLRFYADWSVGQIADALNVPEGTVKSRLSRALASLQSDLQPKEQS